MPVKPTRDAAAAQRAAASFAQQVKPPEPAAPDDKIAPPAAADRVVAANAESTSTGAARPTPADAQMESFVRQRQARHAAGDRSSRRSTVADYVLEVTVSGTQGVVDRRVPACTVAVHGHWLAPGRTRCGNQETR